MDNKAYLDEAIEMVKSNKPEGEIIKYLKQLGLDHQEANEILNQAIHGLFHEKKGSKPKTKPLPPKIRKEILKEKTLLAKRLKIVELERIKKEKTKKAKMRQIRIEKKKQAEKKIKSLQKKLALLEKSYSMGVISKKAFIKDKNQIEKLIEKLSD